MTPTPTALPHIRRLLAAALLAPAALTAAQHIAEIEWSSGTYRHAATVDPGKFFEACGKLPAGATVRWRFEASAAVNFNIHYHQGKDVVYPARLEAVAQAADSLAASVAQDYCWMWTNRGTAPVQVTVTLER